MNNRLPYSPRGAHAIRHRCAFTLVELLSVLAITSVLATLSVSAISGMSRGSALRSGGQRIATLVTLARSEAVARNTLMRFCVASNFPGDSLPRRISVWAYENRALPASNPAAWTQVTMWENVSDRVLVQTNVTKTALPGTYLFSAGCTQTVTVQGSTVEMHYIQFGPTGSLEMPSQPNSPLRVRLSDGSAHNWLDISVDRLTGRARVNDSGDSL